MRSKLLVLGVVLAFGFAGCEDYTIKSIDTGEAVWSGSSWQDAPPPYWDDFVKHGHRIWTTEAEWEQVQLSLKRVRLVSAETGHTIAWAHVDSLDAYCVADSIIQDAKTLMKYGWPVPIGVKGGR